MHYKKTADSQSHCWNPAIVSSFFRSLPRQPLSPKLADERSSRLNFITDSHRNVDIIGQVDIEPRTKAN
ncbi:MAG: hypothetical protein PVH44_05005, partial [Desulfobacterales bacterium]